MAFAIPVAVLDADRIAWPLEVRYAAGDEDYLTFGGETEHPAAGEVIFADQAGRAHARRWTNRQSGRSAVRDSTTAVVIVAEALHDSAAADIRELMAALTGELTATWSVTPPADGADPRLAPLHVRPSRARRDPGQRGLGQREPGQRGPRPARPGMPPAPKPGRLRPVVTGRAVLAFIGHAGRPPFPGKRSMPSQC